QCVEVRGAYPLRFLKEAVAMILSVNNPEFTERNFALAEFVLNREKKYLPTPYAMYLTLVTGEHARMAQLHASIDVAGGYELATGGAPPPFGLVLTVGSPRRPRVGSISHFGSYGYDETAYTDLWLVSGSSDGTLPGTY